MTQYLISFDDGAMTFPEEDLPDVAKAAHEVVQEAKAAGVWVFGGANERISSRAAGRQCPVVCVQPAAARVQRPAACGQRACGPAAG